MGLFSNADGRCHGCAHFACRVGGTFSPVRFEAETCGIAAIFGDSCSNAARFLCNPDCVAERSGFEPSVPFLGMLPRLPYVGEVCWQVLALDTDGGSGMGAVSSNIQILIKRCGALFASAM